jgi:hypothetical protein
MSVRLDVSLLYLHLTANSVISSLTVSTFKCVYNTPLDTGCPTIYQTRQFFNNFTTNEDIAQQLAALQTHSSLFLTYERTAVRISVQYLHWFWNY